MYSMARKLRLTRALTISLATIVLAMAVWCAAHWRELFMLWTCHRLECAATFGEARVSLEAIADAANDPAVRRGFLAQLGPARPRATFWFFSYLLAEDDFSGLRAGKLASNRYAVLGRLSEPFALRLDQDPGLLSLWGQYARWRLGESYWADWDQAITEWSEASWSLDPSGGRRRQAILRLSQERLTYALVCLHKAEAWTLSMEDLDEAGINTSVMDSRVNSWVISHWHRFRFDPMQGRCVLLPPDVPDDLRRLQDRGYPTPTLPWQGWEWPVPRVPELNS